MEQIFIAPVMSLYQNFLYRSNATLIQATYNILMKIMIGRATQASIAIPEQERRTNSQNQRTFLTNILSAFQSQAVVLWVPMTWFVVTTTYLRKPTNIPGSTHLRELASLQMSYLLRSIYNVLAYLWVLQF